MKGMGLYLYNSIIQEDQARYCESHGCLCRTEPALKKELYQCGIDAKRAQTFNKENKKEIYETTDPRHPELHTKISRTPDTPEEVVTTQSRDDNRVIMLLVTSHL